MPDRTAAILGGDAEGCYRRLLDGARLLERGGCTALAIPCNTSHYFADRLQGQLKIPLIHMIRLQGELDIPIVNMVREATGAMCLAGRRRVGILATDGTVQTGIYQRECAARGMEGVTPPADVQKLVMSIIYDEIKRGEKGSREKFALIDRHMRERGCDGAILACTELSVYRAYHGLPDYYLDAMEILAERCITACGYRLRMV